MKAKAFIAVLLLSASLSARADDSHLKPVQASASKAETSWNTNSWLWQDMVLGRGNPSASSGFRLGQSGFTLSGPLVESLRHGKSAPDRSLGQKILAFPLVHLFVPQPMPVGTSGGKYFAWGESNRSWTSLAGGGAAPGPGLISIGW